MSLGLRVVYQISAGAGSPYDARRIVHGELGRFVGSDHLEDLKLLISEIVTDRVSQQPDGEDGDGGFVLDLEAGDGIRCSILDGGPPCVPDTLSSQILDLLADRWGVTRRGGTTQVWFEAGLTP